MGELLWLILRELATTPFELAARRILRTELATRDAHLAQSQANTQALETQLTICRAMLATTMRDRDKFEAAFNRTIAELASVKRLRRKERQALRTWITRETAPRAIYN